MSEHLLVGLTLVLVIGIAAQWIAWRLGIPSILLLLAAGFLAGPLLGLVNPDELLGNLLAPVVSLSVAVILFEGGLTLQIRELNTIGRVVRNLVSIGAGVSWVITALAAHFLAGLSWPMAIVLGAILVVTGPTVIGPLLRHLGPIGPVGSVLKWEGIVIDPIGAMLAVLVFEALLAEELPRGSALALAGVLKTAVVGGGLGFAGALLMNMMIHRHWLPETLDVPLTLMVVVAVFTLSNLLQSEAGLLAATVMGIALANQRNFSVKHIVEFKENLSVLLISSLFILLAARLPLEELTNIGLSDLLFLGAVMLVARPLSVIVSTWGSSLTWKERLFLGWMAPRGIVAAAVSSIFALELVEAGYPEAERLVPLTFVVIVGTVITYGLSASLLARRLGLSQAASQGVLLLGAHSWSRSIAARLQQEGFPVLMVDSNLSNTTAAQLEGLPSYYGNILSDHAHETINLSELGTFLALTPNEEVNSLATLHFNDYFGRQRVYQLPPPVSASKRGGPPTRPLRGRQLFGSTISYEFLDERFSQGATVKATKITSEFSFSDLQEHYNDTVVPLFLVDQARRLLVYTVNEAPRPQAGQKLIFLADPVDEARRTISRTRHAQPDGATPAPAPLPQ